MFEGDISWSCVSDSQDDEVKTLIKKLDSNGTGNVEKENHGDGCPNAWHVRGRLLLQCVCVWGASQLAGVATKEVLNAHTHTHRHTVNRHAHGRDSHQRHRELRETWLPFVAASLPMGQKNRVLHQEFLRKWFGQRLLGYMGFSKLGWLERVGFPL